MRKLELYIFPMVFLVGIALYFLGWPFGNELIIISLFGLSCLYFYFGFAIFNKLSLRRIFKKESYQGISAWRIVGAICTGISISIVLLGVLFKIFRWPFANQLLIIGVSFLNVIFLAGLYKILKEKRPFYQRLMVRVVFYGISGYIFWFIPTYTFLELKYKNHPDYIEAVKRLDKDPENPELIKEELRAFDKMIRE
ncbi:hypothetical protein [Aquimarina sp. SS2-1]|uniref:GldL-related protein n=1 Tax=Aquimarina besae TaxID=3342247 RepID=UPI00366C1333